MKEVIKKLWEDRLEYAYCLIIMIVWFFHVIIFGWFNYLFKPKGWKGKVRDIRTEYLDHQYNKWHCIAIQKVIDLHNPQDEVMFVKRVHPWFLDNEFLYVYSPRYKARIWDNREKLKG